VVVTYFLPFISHQLQQTNRLQKARAAKKKLKKQ